MRKKHMFLYGIFFGLLSGMWMSACKKSTTPAALAIQSPAKYSDAYYANLRAYKASSHAICFLWLADYPITNSASLGERFLGVPDSVDIISLWGGFPDSARLPNIYKEMRYVQKVKGTKLFAVDIVGIGSYSQDDSGIYAYAENLKQQVFNYNLDGLDLDFEPDAFFSNTSNFIKLVARLSQFLGPKSGTGKLLDIDYYGFDPPAELGEYVDYVIQQDYGTSSASQLQSSYDAVSGYISPGQYIATENIGDYWQTGGVSFTDTAGNSMNSLLGFAKWNPSQGRKGGFGAFYAQRDYYNPVPYGYLRTAIQACNPAKQ